MARIDWEKSNRKDRQQTALRSESPLMKKILAFEGWLDRFDMKKIKTTAEIEKAAGMRRWLKGQYKRLSK